MRSLAFAAAVVVAAGCGSAEEETCDAPPPQLLGAGCDGRITMAVADDGVYWVNPCDSSVRYSASPEAGVTVALHDSSLNPFNLGNLLVTPTDFYFGEALGLTRYPRDGSGPTKVLNANLYPTSVVLVNGEAVWMGADQISAQPVNGGTQRALETNPGNPRDLLADPVRQRVYWMNIGTGSTYRAESASLTGGSALGMDTKTTPTLMAQDDTFLYWAVYSRLERTPKTLTEGKESLGQPLKASIRGLTVTSDAIFVLVDAYDLQQFGFGGPPKVFPSAIYRLALDGTPQATVACGVTDVLNGTLREQGGNLYWLGGRGVWTAPVR